MDSEAPLVPETLTRVNAKWGLAAVPGWQALPDVLLKNQSKLDLSPTELVVLINILSFWWYAEKLPFPRISILAKRMNVTPRTVQRCLQELIRKGFITRKWDLGEDKKEREVLDPAGLVEALSKLALGDPAYQHRQQRMREAHELQIAL